MSNPAEFTVPQILQIARICQYLAFNSVSFGNTFKGKSIDERIGRMIYTVREGVQYRYDSNPNDPTLIATANYLWSLLGRFQILARARLAALTVAPPVITGPSTQTVNVGQNATFSTSVASSVPYTVQWFDSSNNPIAGATSTSYVFTNAQLTDSGKTFYMKATNSAGIATSPIAVLVVNSVLVVQFYYGDVDFSAQLLAGVDNVPYAGSINITDGLPFIVPFPVAAANNKFIYVKYPASQPTKTIWNNTPANLGTIPDQAYQNHPPPDNSVVIIGTSKYIISRGQITQDSTQPQVTYS